MEESLSWTIRGFICLAGVAGNSIVLYLVLMRHRLHVTSNWFLLSLAAADLCVGLFVIPSLFVCKFWLPCKSDLQGFFYSIFFYVSVWNLCVLTLDRYMAIIYPLKYTTIMRRKQVISLVATAWTFPVITVPIPFIWKQVTSAKLYRKAERVFSIANLTVMEILPCVAMILAYAHILLTVRRHCRRDEQQTNQVNFNHAVTERRARGRSTIKVTGAVIMLFVLCWVLSVYLEVCRVFGLREQTSAIKEASELLILANSLANPLAYALLKKDIRREFMSLFVCCYSGFRTRANEDCEMRERRVRSSTATSSTAIEL